MASFGVMRSGRSFNRLWRATRVGGRACAPALTSRKTGVKGRPIWRRAHGLISAHADNDEDGRNRRLPPRVLQNDENHPLIRLRPAVSPGPEGGAARTRAGAKAGEGRRGFAMGLKIAVVGATGNVGREMLTSSTSAPFRADEVVAIASRRSQGTEVSFGDRMLKVQALENYDFSRHRYRADVRRRRRLQGMVAEDRGAGLRRHR